MEEESWRTSQGGGIVEEESGRRNHGGGIIEEESEMKDHGGGIMEEESGKRNHAEIIEEESGCRNQEGCHKHHHRHHHGPSSSPTLIVIIVIIINTFNQPLIIIIVAHSNHHSHHHHCHIVFFNTRCIRHIEQFQASTYAIEYYTRTGSSPPAGNQRATGCAPLRVPPARHWLHLSACATSAYFEISPFLRFIAENYLGPGHVQPPANHAAAQWPQRQPARTAACAMDIALAFSISTPTWALKKPGGSGPRTP